MDSKYYTHFVLTEFEGSGFGEFSGVVQFAQSEQKRKSKLDADEARRLLAQNFAVDVNDLHLIQFSQLH